ncbi:MAG: D-alanine--D-alanine ligase, partial [Byssovorax sp.]
RAAARALVDRYGQPALVEEYIAGRELTVGLLGEKRPKMLPPMEVVFVAPAEHPVYGFEEKQSGTTSVRFECPAPLTPLELKKVEKTVRDTFAALGCRDVARIDLRMTKDGTVFVIEVNPLPGLTPDFSDLCVIGKVAGMDYRTLIGEILAGSIKRFREKKQPASLGPLTGAAPVVTAAGGAKSSLPTAAPSAPQLTPTPTPISAAVAALPHAAPSSGSVNGS